MPNYKETLCVVCNAPIKYLTKKPSKCIKCKAIKKTSKKSHQTKWKNESSIFQILNTIFKGYDQITNGYYSFLPSPKDSPMQLDWYCPELKLAVEVQGKQHYEFVKYISKTKKSFDYLQECDIIKAQLCKQLGITLVAIKYVEKATEERILEIIKEARPDIGRRNKRRDN